MIPFDPSIFLYLYIAEIILWITPLFVLIALLVVLRTFYLAHKEQTSFFKTFFKRKFFSVLSIIIFALTAILSIVSTYILDIKKEYQSLDKPSPEHERQVLYQQMRQSFVLEHDHLYGDFTFPKGTLINRYDPSDNGEETYPLILSGLTAAQFPKPIKFAGVLTTRIAARGLVELAKDQDVGPIHYYSSKYGEYGGWVVDRTVPTVFCPKGSVAMFEKPSGPDMDLDNEQWWKEKDGADAHFQPSKWQFRQCSNDQAIEILPAFGTEEAIAREKTLAAMQAHENSQPQTIIKDGVLMDAEPVIFTISFYLEAMNHYLLTAQKSGLDADYLEAFKLFEKAAENGESQAYYYLGIMSYQGEGTPQDKQKALFWLSKAADIGNASAAAIIGRLYLEEDSMQDYGRALDIFNKAAEKGDLIAEFYLGKMYAQGSGVEQNYQTALEWFKKASDPKHGFGMAGEHRLSIQAMANVGQIYAQGLVGNKDPAAAEPWFEKACYLDHDKACEWWEAAKS